MVETILAGIALLIAAITALIALAEFIAKLTKTKRDDEIVKKFANGFQAVVTKLIAFSLYKPKK